MTALCDIAWAYKTDKCARIKHHFTEYYYDILWHRRHDIRKVVEIGIGCMEPYFIKGASLYMWRASFPHARIYGADIEPGLMFKDERIETFLCDQTKADDLERLIEFTGSDVDLFVDDGLHEPEVQVATCLTLMPLLDKKVTYVIEDVGRPSFINRLTDYQVEVWQPRHRRYQDDRLVIVRHHGES